MAFGEDEDTMFGHLIPVCSIEGCTKNDTATVCIEDIAAATEPFIIEVELVEEQNSTCDLDVLATEPNALSWLQMRSQTKRIRMSLSSYQALLSERHPAHWDLRRNGCAWTCYNRGGRS